MKKLLSIVLAMAMVASMAVTASADDSEIMLISAEIVAEESTAVLTMDGEALDVAAYEIAGNNYYKLRDLGIMADFDVSWDAETETIIIDTTSSYIDDEAVVEEVEEVAEEVEAEEVTEEVAEEVAEEVEAEEVTEEEVVEEVEAEEVTEEEVVEEVEAEEVTEEEVVEEVVEEVIVEEVVEEVIVEEVVEEEMTIIVSTAMVTVDGEAVEMAAYEINDNNYFKLRDVAAAVAGTEKQFDVAWDAETYTISVILDQEYGTVDAEEAAAAEAAAAEEVVEEEVIEEVTEEEVVEEEVAEEVTFSDEDKAEWVVEILAICEEYAIDFDVDVITAAIAEMTSSDEAMEYAEMIVGGAVIPV